eukprot:c23971_g2_i3 orf=402-1403(-)
MSSYNLSYSIKLSPPTIKIFNYFSFPMGDQHHSNEAAHITLGLLGNMASCLFFLSSAPTIVRIVRSKSNGGLSGDLYVLKLFNCMLWCLYGLPFVHPHDVWVVLTNSFGCVFALMYILTYFCYGTTHEKISLLWKLCTILSSFIVMVVLLVLLSRSQRQKILVVGTISTIVSSGMHITLLSQCRLAIQLRERKFLHPNASLAAFLKGAIWTAYGLVDFDIFILIPNGVGVMIGIIQVILVFFLMKSEEPKLDREEGGNKDMGQMRRSLELKIECNEIDKDQETLDSTIKVRRASLSSISRASSLLGPPRQGSISSSLIVPITLNDNDVVPFSH